MLARGTAAAPILFTGPVEVFGWYGIVLDDAPSPGSYLTNVRIENVQTALAVWTSANHPVVIDSAVFRNNGAAAWLYAADSRISHTRVDTTVYGDPAVRVAGQNRTIESLLIRGTLGKGLAVDSRTVQVLSCEIRDSGGDGIQLSDDSTVVHNCNLVNNGGVGISVADASYTANVENNWWGDAAGPTGPNGDGVGASLDYTTWRTSPYTLPYVP